MKIYAIIQARMSSTRLNGKVLKDFAPNVNALSLLVSRLKESNKLTGIIIATTDNPADMSIVQWSRKNNIKCIRGSEEDVLSRYLLAARDVDSDIVVRITSDCPFVDPKMVDEMIDDFIQSKFDYYSNCNSLQDKLPDGFDIEIFSYNALNNLDEISITKSSREHVTFGFFQTSFFKIGSKDYSHARNYKKKYGDYRITLDYDEDYQLIKSLYEKLPDPVAANWFEICEILSELEPHANSHIQRNASWALSKVKDGENLNFADKRDGLIAGSSGLLSKRKDQFSSNWPSNYIFAKRNIIVDDQGKTYQDFSIGGIGACTLGYGNKYVDDAVIEQIKRGVSSSINPKIELDAAAKLKNILKWPDLFRFAKGGGEANAIAVRIAKAYSKKNIVMYSGYHGWHDWYIASAFNNKTGNHLLNYVPHAGVSKSLADEIVPFTYGDKDDFIEKFNIYKNEIGAVILEPMRYSEPANDFLGLIRELTEKNNTPLIFDEISCGFRFNNNTVSQEIGITPDILTLSKSIGNGYPIAVVAGASNVMSSVKDTFISSTTHTEATGLAAMSAVLDIYSNEDISGQLRKNGLKVMKILKEVVSKYELEIEIKGLPQLWSWNFAHEENRSLQSALTENLVSQGVLFCNRYYAMTEISEFSLRIFEEKLDQTLFRIAKNMNNLQDVYSGNDNTLGVY